VIGPLFTLIFLVLIQGSGERIGTVRSKQAFTESECKEHALTDRQTVIDFFQETKGIKVSLLAFCVPEERKA